MRGAPITVEETGNTVGARRGCKVGDFVLRYTSEHAFANAYYTEHRALAELDESRANRCAQVGLFIMVARTGFVPEARALWAERSSAGTRTTRALIRGSKAALTIALVSRTKSVGTESDLAALRDVEERFQAELKRLEKMGDSTQGIRRNCDNLEEELGKARKGFNLLLRNAEAPSPRSTLTSRKPRRARAVRASASKPPVARSSPSGRA